jgi:hypothetical protein
MHGVKVLMAKNYIDNLSEETRKGMTEKAAFFGSRPSFWANRHSLSLMRTFIARVCFFRC